MLGVVYVSEAKEEFPPRKLDELAVFSMCRNAEFGITGYLYFENGYFIQYIEGECEPVTRLMSRIELDCRHEVLAVARDVDLSVRRFPDWSMQQIHPSELVQFRLENALADAILSLEPDRAGRLESIWQWVDRIAELQDAIVSSR